MSQTASPRHLRPRPGFAETVVPRVASRRAMVTTGAAVSIPATVASYAAAPHASATPLSEAPTAAPTTGPATSYAAGTVAPVTTRNVVWLRYGSTGSLVRVLQQRLGGLTVDGTFGPATLARVKAFQSQHRATVAVDGLVGPATWAALGGYPGPPVAKPPTPGKPGPCSVVVVRYGSRGSSVTVVQERLGITADGDFGPATRSAVRSFQARKGLTVDGIVAPATWTALGGFPCGTSTTTPPTSTPPPPPVGDPRSPYRLPFPGGDTFKVTQGPDGAYSHNTVWNDHAVDVSMPIGTPVLAARGGVVKSTGYTSAGGGNYVLIQDASGLCQVYFHLSSYKVVAGQSVVQGQRVASSGNTGDSSGPHLHFDLLDCSSWHSVKVMSTVERGTSYPDGTWITSKNAD